MPKTCIIIGASHAAAQLSQSLRQQGWQGQVIIIGEESYLPYHRPPLSKAFLLGEKNVDSLLIRSAAFYEKHNIELKLNARVTRIDRADQRVSLDNGESLRYDRLVLCTGSRARKIPLPGSDLSGVHYMRSMADVEGIKKHVSQGKQSVIIGGGYIGLEAAAVLNKMGMDVTVLEMMDRVLQRVSAVETSEFFTRIHEEEGVHIKTNVVVKSIAGVGKAEAVVCHDGSRYEADLVIIGAGIVPNVELADEAGLAVDNGVLVDEYCMTSDERIFAAGDCTNGANPLLGRRIRLESVANALEQAKIVAAAICEKPKPNITHPWFWSDQYDIKLQIAGLNEGYDQIVIEGDQHKGRSFVAWYLKDGKLLAADCINQPKAFITAKKRLADGGTIPSA